jgi:hypothetical protein
MTEAASLTVAYSLRAGTITRVSTPRRRRAQSRPGETGTAKLSEATAGAGVSGSAVAVVVEATDTDEVTSPDQLVESLRDSVELARQLHEISDRMGTDAREMLAAMMRLATTTPLADATRALTDHDESVLREAGSLAQPRAPLASRPSTATTVATLALVSDALTVKDAAARLGVTTGRIRQRIAARTLLAVEAGGAWKLPAFQFAGTDVVRGLDRVVPVLPADAHPLVVQRFLTTPHPDLEVDGEPASPLTWLSGGGDIDAVVGLAEDLHTAP